MLRYLAEHTRLPVPQLLHGDDSLLLMDFVEGGHPLGYEAQADAAIHLAALHAVRGASFGLERDTVIGGLRQPNPPGQSWRDFFRDHRLLYMARKALEHGRLTSAQMARIERLAVRLESWIDEPPHPALVHGDCWAGNVLCRSGRVAAFVDPALSYSDPEIELAFGTMFGTFGESFYRRYDEISPIRPGFWEVRCEIYTLWPLLVHVRLFGMSYMAAVERVLDRLA
jgi:fructosamine-3-kinase